MYPEYTGTLLSAVAEPDEGTRRARRPPTRKRRRSSKKTGLTLLNYTPFYDSDALATLPSYASAHNLSSIADLKPLGKSVMLGGPPEFATRFEGLLGLKQEYGVDPDVQADRDRTLLQGARKRTGQRAGRVQHRRAAAERQVQAAERPQARVRLPERRAGRQARACSPRRARRSNRRSTRSARC